jgi:N6-L-threonylcarbamoyladenine synthase
VREQATEADRRAFAFPRSRVAGWDFSFSGLKTAVLQEIRKTGLDPLPEATSLALAASAQEAIVDILVEKTMRAAKSVSARSIVISGGVACNSRLRERMPDAYFPPPKHCADNAAMIAWIGYRDAVLGGLRAS